MKEYIEKDVAINDIVLALDIDKDYSRMDIAARLHDLPAANVREVVTCGECIYWITGLAREYSHSGRCKFHGIARAPEAFCSDGLKEEN